MGSIHLSIAHVRCWMTSSAEFHTHDYRTFLFTELSLNYRRIPLISYLY